MTTPRERIRQLGRILGLKVVEASIETEEEKAKRIMLELGKQVEPRMNKRFIPDNIIEKNPTIPRPEKVDFVLPRKGTPEYYKRQSDIRKILDDDGEV